MRCSFGKSRYDLSDLIERVGDGANVLAKVVVVQVDGDALAGDRDSHLLIVNVDVATVDIAVFGWVGGGVVVHGQLLSVLVAPRGAGGTPNEVPPVRQVC